MVIGFWNLERKNLSDLLVSLTLEQGLEILILAEATEQTVSDFLTKSLAVMPDKIFYDIPVSKGNTKVLTSFSDTVFKDNSALYHSNRWVANTIEIPNVIKFNLFSIHFYSRRNWSENSLAMACAVLAQDITLVEEKAFCNETILIGDFNMNPFEYGMVAANGINAIQDLQYAYDKREKGREIDGQFYRYFYNPMWNLFGDHKQPYGTYYYRASGHVSYEWHIYDQVLFRPSLKNHTSQDSVKIIDNISGIRLTSELNRPLGGPRNPYSDHLPITINLII